VTPRRALLLFFRRMLCLEPAKLCPVPGLRVQLYRWMGAKVGRGVFIGFGVELDTNHPELIEIGDGVTISHRCTLVSHMATDAQTPLRELYPERAAPVKIGAGAWLCVGAVVLPGVTIGENALVAAGAVVTRDVPAGTLVAGVPARVVKALPLRGGGA
jgi:acetyltransferase-like isoleucine patch superfamily enzyme